MGKFLDRATSRLDSDQRLKRSKATGVQDAAREALAKWLDPLSAFIVDCGLSVSEVNSILRTAAVHTAAARQLKDSDRVNISGIAAVTGISRGEVSRILHSGGTRFVICVKRAGKWGRGRVSTRKASFVSS